MVECIHKEYQELCEVKKRQATNDLKELEEKSIFEKVGVTGKGVYYILSRIKGANGALKGQKRGKSGSRRPPPTEWDSKDVGRGLLPMQ